MKGKGIEETFQVQDNVCRKLYCKASFEICLCATKLQHTDKDNFITQDRNEHFKGGKIKLKTLFQEVT